MPSAVVIVPARGVIEQTPIAHGLEVLGVYENINQLNVEQTPDVVVDFWRCCFLRLLSVLYANAGARWFRAQRVSHRAAFRAEAVGGERTCSKLSGMLPVEARQRQAAGGA